jgi:SMP-30/Gluconolactonase/LRE-like region
MSFKVITIVGVLSVLCAWPASTFGQATDVRTYVQNASAAYKRKDYAALIDNMKQALRERPNYWRYNYNIAVGYALSGDAASAVRWLNQLADMGLVMRATSDENFNSIKDADSFKAVVARFETNAKRIGNSQNAFTVKEKGLVPEGLAYDSVEKTLYVGSIYKKRIVSIDQNGEARDFSSPNDGLWSVAGMRVDTARRLLWVCTASQPQMMNFNESEKGLSGIFKYDLKTKKLIKKYFVPQDGSSHWLGDLVLDSRGNVFASDSVTPAIYKIDREQDLLELFLTNRAFVNPQGLAFSSDGKHLFMADYLKGIFAIQMKSKSVSPVTPTASMTLLGIDGLYVYQGRLVGVQNGVPPNRIVEMLLDPTATRVLSFKALEANNPLFDEPTLAVIVKDSLFYIANSQWAAVDEKGNLAGEEKLQDAVILKLKL